MQAAEASKYAEVGVSNPTRSYDRRWIRIVTLFAAWAGVALILGLIPGRARIAPRIESDYCYQLLAADRMYDGLGLTSIQPAAPLQPWAWQYDWGYLTQWPPGFALLIVGLRTSFGLSTVTACQWISVLVCATALVGWFLWVRRIVPSGVAGVLVAATASGCALPIHFLVDPSSDALLAAALPFVLLLTVGRACRHGETGDEANGSSTLRLCLVGLIAGGLVWFRYAAVFVAPAIGCFLLIRWRWRQGVRFRQVAWYTVCALIPVIALMVTNRVLGAGSTQQQFNVGQTIGMHLTPQLVLSAWGNFTNLGFYDYHWFSRWIWTLWPVVLIAVSLSVRPLRRMFVPFSARPEVCLSALVLFLALAMLIAATSMFGDKFDYVALLRYYDPIRPFYFVLFAAPVLLLRHRVVRVGVGLACFVACAWIVQQDWRQPYQKLRTARQTSTPYEQAEEAFPGRSSQLYLWLAEQAALELVLISNFHEYVSLETGIAAFPIPKDVDTLNRWITDIRTARDVDGVRILFVLDPDNRWRGYWQPDPVQTAQQFDLRPGGAVPEGIADLVFEYQPRRENPRLGQREGGAISTAPVRKRPCSMSVHNHATPPLPGFRAGSGNRRFTLRPRLRHRVLANSRTVIQVD